MRTSDSSRRALLAAVVFLAAFLAVAATVRDPGLTWDESIYFGRAARLVGWFQSIGSGAFQKEALLRAWWSADHPPLGSLWIAGSFALFGSLPMITAARLGAAALFALAAMTIFLWVSRRRSRGEALLAAALFALMPRLFAHGHFANLEMMTLLLWTLTVVAFEKGIESRRWSALAGLFFGLSLLTKINGAFLPFLLVPWGLIFHGRKSLRNVAMMALMGPLIFLAGWPVMWVEPLGAIKAYLANKGAQRMILPVEYLGQVYRDRFAPWHYPFVMMLVTTPLVALIGAAAGGWDHLRRLRRQFRSSAHEALLLWAFLFPVLLLAFPGAPKYDGIRLMLPAYPFLAILAARGLALIWERLRARAGSDVAANEEPTLRRQVRTAHRFVRTFARFPHGAAELRARALRVAAAGLAAAGILVPVVLFHPYQLSYYNALAGGPWGARRLGFETTYWDDTFDAKALAYLNNNVPQGGKVAFVAMGDFVWQIYQINREARADIAVAEFEGGGWDYLVVIPRQGWWTDSEREFIRTHEPVWTNTLTRWDRLPVCMIFKRTERTLGP